MASRPPKAVWSLTPPPRAFIHGTYRVSAGGGTSGKCTRASKSRSARMRNTASKERLWCCSCALISDSHLAGSQSESKKFCSQRPKRPRLLHKYHAGATERAAHASCDTTRCSGSRRSMAHHVSFTGARQTK
eukprot:1341342-Prymnesium_polylepis.4